MARRTCDGTTNKGNHNCERWAAFVVWLAGENREGEGWAACSMHLGQVATTLSDGEPARFEVDRIVSDEK